MSQYESLRGQGPPQPQRAYDEYHPYDQDNAQYNQRQGRDEEQGGQSYQMTPVNGNDPNQILNECRAVDRAVDEIEAKLQHLAGLRDSYQDANDVVREKEMRRQIDELNLNIMAEYRNLVGRVRRIKENRESGSPRNSAQVGKIDRRVKTAINKFQQDERDYRKTNQENFRRQYMIVRPDASEAEVREALDAPQQQIFSQALINSDRRGQAQSARSNVESRHAEIQKIEQQMMELAQLFQDLDTLVVQQEPAVTQIEQKGEEVNDHVAKANTELDGAVKKARAARRKKWICLGIIVAIIAALIIIILAVLGAQGKL